MTSKPKFEKNQVVKNSSGQFGVIYKFVPKFLWIDAYYEICLARPWGNKGQFLVSLGPVFRAKEDELRPYLTNQQIIKERLHIK